MAKLPSQEVLDKPTYYDKSPVTPKCGVPTILTATVKYAVAHHEKAQQEATALATLNSPKRLS